MRYIEFIYHIYPTGSVSQANHIFFMDGPRTFLVLSILSVLSPFNIHIGHKSTKQNSKDLLSSGHIPFSPLWKKPHNSPDFQK